jgi:hypothetical protein
MALVAQELCVILVAMCSMSNGPKILKSNTLICIDQKRRMLYNTCMDTQTEFRAIADQLVAGMVGEQLVADWWASPNRAFDGRTPEAQWAEGSDRVVNYLMHHAFSGGGS